MSRTDEIRVKIERARKHINELEIAYNLFFASRPYEINSKSDPNTGDRIFFIERIDSVPLNLSAIVGDVLQNLRSALDHLAYQLFRIGPGGTGDPRHVYFPIFDNAAKYKTGVMGKVKGMRQDAIDAIDTIKPYKGGDETLWRLHALNNRDKHRLLLTAVTSYKLHSLTPSQRARFTEGFKGSRPNDPIPNLRGVFTEPIARIPS